MSKTKIYAADVDRFCIILNELEALNNVDCAEIEIVIGEMKECRHKRILKQVAESVRGKKNRIRKLLDNMLARSKRNRIADGENWR